MNILVVGNFGYKSNQIDGQTVKTRELFNALLKYSNHNCTYFDLDNYKREPLKLFQLIYVLLKNDHIFFLPGRNALRILSPIILIMSKICRTKIHYIVVGGWLPELVQRSKYVKVLLKFYNSIFVELESMSLRLAKLSINSFVIYNFRDIDSEVILSIHNTLLQNKDEIKNDTIRFVFFSRVMREKGILEAISVVKSLKKDNLDVVLDIYGPLNDLNILTEIESESANMVSYKGILVPGNQIYSTLTKYDYFLLPTTYQGEGFPGALVDAMMSGVYPIVSDWKYNKEIITSLGFGQCFSLDSYHNSSIDYILGSYKQINKMKLECFDLASVYYAKNAISDITVVLDDN